MPDYVRYSFSFWEDGTASGGGLTEVAVETGTSGGGTGDGTASAGGQTAVCTVDVYKRQALAKAAEHLAEPELLDLKRIYEAQAARRFPPVPQLRSRGAVRAEDETEFLI